MYNDQQEFEAIRKGLSGIKLWVAIGAIGFVLIGVAAVVFSISLSTMMNYSREKAEETQEMGEDKSSFWDDASDYFKQGDKEKLLGLIEERLHTHPNDAQVFWFRARAHMLDKNWEAAIADVETAHLLSPNWGRKYTIPMRDALREKLDSQK